MINKRPLADSLIGRIIQIDSNPITVLQRESIRIELEQKLARFHSRMELHGAPEDLLERFGELYKSNSSLVLVISAYIAVTDNVLLKYFYAQAALNMYLLPLIDEIKLQAKPEVSGVGWLLSEFLDGCSVPVCTVMYREPLKR